MTMTTHHQHRNTTIQSSLTRKLILSKHPKQRIANEAVLMTSELLRLFILEARNRASVEAECEKEANPDDDDSKTDGIRIKAHNITKIAAELLMDFS